MAPRITMDWRVAQIGAEIAQYGPKVQRPNNVRMPLSPCPTNAFRKPNPRDRCTTATFPSPACGEGREGACGRNARASHEHLPPLASLRSPPPPQAGEDRENRSRSACAPEFCRLQPREARTLGLRTKTERWILCFPVRFTPFAEPNTVARMERSEIRGLSIRFKAAPGLRFAPSGLRRKKEAERRQTRVLLPHPSMRLPPPNVPRFSREARRGARLSASHHGSRQRESSSLRLSSRPCFLGRGLNGRYPPSPVPAQGNTPRPGHSAGGLMPEAARGKECMAPPAGTALAPTAGEYPPRRRPW